MTLRRKGRRAVIGIDVGTLPGPAAVVSVTDGATVRSRAIQRTAAGG
jgi:hypothetical protein